MKALVEIFSNDSNFAEVSLTLLQEPDFAPAVRQALLDRLRGRGAPASVLEDAESLATRVLGDLAELEALLHSIRPALPACRATDPPHAARGGAAGAAAEAARPKGSLRRVLQKLGRRR